MVKRDTENCDSRLVVAMIRTMIHLVPRPLVLSGDELDSVELCCVELGCLCGAELCCVELASVELSSADLS